MTPYFPKATLTSSDVAKHSCLLLRIPFKVFNFSCGYALHLVMWKVFILTIFLALLQLSTSKNKLPFLVFLTVLELVLLEITFSIQNGDNLARQVSSKDARTMNLGKSATLVSKSDSERFYFIFYLLFVLYWSTHHGIQILLGI